MKEKGKFESTHTFANGGFADDEEDVHYDFGYGDKLDLGGGRVRWFKEWDGDKMIVVGSREDLESDLGSYAYPSNVQRVIERYDEDEEDDDYANGGGFANDPFYIAFMEKRDKLYAQLKSRVVRAVGIDEAMEFFDYDYSNIAPYKFIERAVQSNLIALDEINKELVDSAIEESREIDNDEDLEEIGSSDFTYYLQHVLDNAGFKVGFVNDRLQRLNEDGSVKEIENNFADGGFMNDVYAKGGSVPSEIVEHKDKDSIWFYQSVGTKKFHTSLWKKQDGKFETNSGYENKTFDKKEDAIEHAKNGLKRQIDEYIERPNSLKDYVGKHFVNAHVFYYIGGLRKIAYKSSAWSERKKKMVSLDGQYKPEFIVLRMEVNNKLAPYDEKQSSKETTLDFVDLDTMKRWTKNNNLKTIKLPSKLQEKVDSHKKYFERFEGKKLEDGGFMNDVYANGGGVDDEMYKLAKSIVRGTDYKIGLYLPYRTDFYLKDKKGRFGIGSYLVLQDEDNKNEWTVAERKYDKLLGGYYEDKKSGITQKQAYDVVKELINSKYADGGFMNDVYADGGSVETEIHQLKRKLIQQAKSKGISENFGQKEVRMLEDKYPMNYSVGQFDEWVQNFDLNSYADGGFMNDVYAKGGELKGKFLAEIKVPYNYESVVKDEFEFTEFLSKALTKKWFGNGVWGVKIVKSLFGENYGQKIVVEIEIPVGVTQGGGLDKFDVGEFISKTLTKKWFGNGIWGVDIVSSYADGGFMNDVYAKGGSVETEIHQLKRKLIQQAKSKGISENFGQKEVRMLEDKYPMNYSVSQFDEWVQNFDLNSYADGGMFEDNDGFMKADNEFNYRYPEMEVYVETLDEPIDLTNNVSSRTNEVVIMPLDEKMDLTDDNRVRARMGYEPKNRTPEKIMMVNQRMVIKDLPTPMSNTHKND
jgi:hypothetical protein